MCVSSISTSALRFPVASASDMFDWDDSELANILWDEATENSDHIVPYPKGSEDCRNKKEWKEQTALVKPNEQKERGSKVDLNEKLPESSSNLVSRDGSSASGLGMESWPDMPPSNAVNNAQEAVSNEVSGNLNEIAKYDTARGTDQHDKDEIYQSNQESKEQGDFVDYSWANIGSFDDFDRIFSNDDAVFGHTSLDNSDGLWSSSRDVGNSTVKSFPDSSDLHGLGPESLSNTSQHLKLKTKFVQKDDLSCSLGYEETDNSTSPSLRGILNRVGDAACESKPVIKEQTGVDMVGNTTVAITRPAAQNKTTGTDISDKVRKQKKSMRSRKRMEEKSEGKQSLEMHSSWSTISPPGQLENRLAHPMTQHSPSLVPHVQLRGPELYTYQHVSNQLMARPIYGNLANPFPAMPVLSHIQPGKFKHQQLFSNNNVLPSGRNHVNNSAEASVKPVTMTPQEKIEKLRRLQQLRAMLAIEKQQQQLSQQIPSTKHSTIQSGPQKQKGVADHEIDDLSTFSSLETNSPLEQDDSNTISSTIDEYSIEEVILHRLQDVIAKLDMKVRFCIRDGLFRLAQSARQRQSCIDTNSTKIGGRDEHEALAKEETNSVNRFPDGETETNSIDRTIAHLLFHRPPELPAKNTEASESPRSTKMQNKNKTAFVPNVPETFTNNQSLVHQDSIAYPPLVDPEQYQDSPCAATSENASSMDSPTRERSPLNPLNEAKPIYRQ